MERGAVIRGRLHGRVIELDEPVDDVEEGEVEVQIRSIETATPRPPDVLEVIASLPAGKRTKADIDQQLADGRFGWCGRKLTRPIDARWVNRLLRGRALRASEWHRIKVAQRLGRSIAAQCWL